MKGGKPTSGNGSEECKIGELSLDSPFVSASSTGAAAGQIHFFLAYSTMPLMSMTTQGSLPTTHASCLGGICDTSPGPNSSFAPSSISTCSRPDTWYDRWGASQLFVLARGFTQVDHFQPG